MEESRGSFREIAFGTLCKVRKLEIGTDTTIIPARSQKSATYSKYATFLLPRCPVSRPFQSLFRALSQASLLPLEHLWRSPNVPSLRMFPSLRFSRFSADLFVPELFVPELFVPELFVPDLFVRSTSRVSFFRDRVECQGAIQYGIALCAIAI